MIEIDKRNLNMLMTLTRSRINTAIVEHEGRNLLQNRSKGSKVTEIQGVKLTLKVIRYQYTLR